MLYRTWGEYSINTVLILIQHVQLAESITHLSLFAHAKWKTGVTRFIGMPRIRTL